MFRQPLTAEPRDLSFEEAAESKGGIAVLSATPAELSDAFPACCRRVGLATGANQPLTPT